MHKKKDKKLAPANGTKEGIHKVADDPYTRSGHTSQLIDHSQRSRQVVRTSARTYNSSLSGEPTSEPSDKASFVAIEQAKTQRICPEDLRFYQKLIHDLFGDLPDAGTHKVTDSGERLAALATEETAGARRPRLSITLSTITKRAMSHPSILTRKRQRSSRPHQVTLETDDDDIDDAAPSKSNAIDDDDKTIGVELQTVRVDEILQACSSLEN